MRFFSRAVACLCGLSIASRAWAVSDQGFWGGMDDVDAANMTAERFKDEYVMLGKPVIIRNDPMARAVADGLTLKAVLDMCGTRKAELGTRVVRVLEYGLSDEIRQTVDERLNYTDGVLLKDAILELNGMGTTRTLRDYFEGPFFTKPVETAQDPRFPGALKDWSHPADFMWPPSVRSYKMGKCLEFVMRVKEILEVDIVGEGFNERYAITNIPYVRALMADDLNQQRHYKKAGNMMHLYASGDKARGTPPHIHGFPSHSVMLVLKGKKRIVTWPPREQHKLYPVWTHDMGANDVGEKNNIFMVNAFDVDLKTQPDLANVTGGLQGEAGVGDLIYIPCGSVHSLETVGSTIALSWLRTESEECPHAVDRP